MIYLLDGKNYFNNYKTMARTNIQETDMVELKTISVTDPALNTAVSTTILDTYSGVIITTTGASNAQTLQTPTNTTDIKRFSVVNNDTSTNSITVNGNLLGVGEVRYFIRDGSAWTSEAIGGTQQFTKIGIGVAPTNYLDIYNASASGTYASIFRGTAGISVVLDGTFNAINSAGKVMKVGTTDELPVDVYTNGALSTRFHSGGNVSIGSNVNNSYKLEVTGDINLTGDLYQGGVLFGGGGLSWGDAITGTTGAGIDISFYATNTQATGLTYGIRIGTKFNTSSTNSSRLFSIQNENNAGTGYNTGILMTNNSTEFLTGGQGCGIGIGQYGPGGTAISVYGAGNVNSSTNGLVNYELSNSQTGTTVMQKIDTGTSAQDHTSLYLTGTRHSMYIGDTTAPATTTNRLYSAGGNLFRNGTQLN